MQIAAGAEVIVTQPPLLWDRFEAWMNKVQQYVSSSANQLLCALCSRSTNPNIVTVI